MAKKSASREWLEAIIIAFVIIIFVRGFVFDLFTIPTSSMENTILAGDYVLVSKLNYGARTPITPLSIPLFHKIIPHTSIPSFLNWVQLSYHRLPGFSKIKRNDVVVFNYPVEQDYPIDERTYFVKRCVALPGDTLKIKNHNIFINSIVEETPIHAEFQYKAETKVETDGRNLDDSLLSSLSITEGGPTSENNSWLLTMPSQTAEELKSQKFIKSVTLIAHPFDPHDFIFPYDKKYPWSIDEFGPIYIPKAGDSISITSDNLVLYKKIIEDDENNKIAIIGKDIYINDKLCKTYTFKMNYYFMMGDNRDNSADSRYWSFVPENHIVGKTVMVLCSFNNEGSIFSRIRWKRMFSFVH